MEIKDLIQDQVNITAAFRKTYLEIVERNIKKYGLEKSRQKILDEIFKEAPKYIIKGLQLGVDWTNGKI